MPKPQALSSPLTCAGEGNVMPTGRALSSYKRMIREACLFAILVEYFESIQDEIMILSPQRGKLDKNRDALALVRWKRGKVVPGPPTPRPPILATSFSSWHAQLQS